MTHSKLNHEPSIDKYSNASALSEIKIISPNSFTKNIFAESDQNYQKAQNNHLEKEIILIEYARADKLN